MNLDYYLIFAYVASIVLFLGTPGPVTILVVNSSVRSGFRAGLSTILGTNLASLILIAISFIVIKGVFSINQNILTWLTLFGALYLIYFSIDIIKTSDAFNKDENTTLTQNKSFFRNGFIIGISNPKDILFFIAFFPSFLGISDNLYISMLILVIVWIILDYLILSVYSLFFSKIMNAKLAKYISLSSGLILLGLALYILYAASVKVI